MSTNDLIADGIALISAVSAFLSYNEARKIRKKTEEPERIKISEILITAAKTRYHSPLDQHLTYIDDIPLFKKMIEQINDIDLSNITPYMLHRLNDCKKSCESLCEIGLDNKSMMYYIQNLYFTLSLIKTQIEETLQKSITTANLKQPEYMRIHYDFVLYCWGINPQTMESGAK